MEASRSGPFEGTYFDGETAQRHGATVRIQPGAIRIELADGTVVAWPYEEVRQTQGSRAGEPIRLERGLEPPEVLVLPDQNALGAIRAVAPGHRKRFTDPTRRRGRRRMALAVTAGVVLAGAVGYVWGIPVLAAHVATLVPLEWEESVGRTAVESAVGGTPACAHPEVLDRVIARLASTQPSRYTFRMTVVDDTLVNAFAAPGGSLVIYRGLLELAETPDELVGVIAHEMQHVLLQHGTESVLRAIPLRLVVAAVTADAGLAGHVIGTAAALGALRYSRRDEEEADREGMRMIRDAGGDPRGMVTFLGRLDARVGDVPRLATYLSTHPSTRERLRVLRALAADSGSTTTPHMTETEWRALRGACAVEPMG